MAIYKVKFTTSYHVMSVLFTILYVIFTGIICSWWQRISSRVDSSTEQRVQPSIVQMDQPSIVNVLINSTEQRAQPAILLMC